MVSRDWEIRRHVLAHTRAIRCCVRPVFATREARSARLPKKPVARKNKGACKTLLRQRAKRGTGLGRELTRVPRCYARHVTQEDCAPLLRGKPIRKLRRA